MIPNANSVATPGQDPVPTLVGTVANARRQDHASRLAGRPDLAFTVSPAALVEMDQRHGRRAERYRARQGMRAFTTLPRVARCGWTASTGGDVEVRVSGIGAESRAGISGVATCGSVWSCPPCAEKIQQKRRGDLSHVVGTAFERRTLVQMGTFTLRHTAADRLDAVWNDVAGAWRAVTQDGTVRKRFNLAGLVGWTRVVEVTHGAAGFHAHVHCIAVFDPPETIPDELLDDVMDAVGAAMMGAWARWLAKKPGRSVVPEAQDWRAGRPGDADALGEYLAKHEFRARAAGGGLAAEATMSAHKRGRFGNRTMFEILADVLALRANGKGPEDAAKLARDEALWAEWEQASRGRRQLEWSRGARDLRKWAGLGEEITDEEAAAEEMGGEVAIVLPRRTWKAVRARSWELLDVAERSGADGLGAWLDARGLPWFERERGSLSDDDRAVLDALRTTTTGA